MTKDKLKKKLDMHFNYKDALGYFIIYGVLILFMIPVMYNIAPFWLFIIYITNIDQLTLALTVSFPKYFNNVYTDDSEYLIPDISYHLIKIISLTGIFLYGLQMKLIGRKDIEVLEGMIVIAIITYTLPDFLLPYVSKYFHSFLKNIKYSKIIISTSIAIVFIIVEGIILTNYIHTKHIASHGKRLF